MKKINKESLAIVSSYNEQCGNASYTKSLVAGLEAHYNVTVVPLNTTLLRTAKSKEVATYIKTLKKELQKYDNVNIQFESGLYGITARSIRKRFVAIAKSCKNLMVTMHRFDSKVKIFDLTHLLKRIVLCKPHLYLKELRKIYTQNNSAIICACVIRYCKRRKVPILVHTKRDQELIQLKFKYNNIFDHPLCFFTQDSIDDLSKSYSKKDFRDHFGLSEKKIYLGVFGFITDYKGYETAIKALVFLPKNYELLIFGRQHPLSIQANEPVNNYIKHLMDSIEALNLVQRVKFFELTEEEAFLKALISCDFNILPYLEVNQGGSGIAALSLETNSNAIFSQNLAFLELSKYALNAFKMFSIGNYLELANAIQSYRKTDYNNNLMEYHKKYNIQTSAALYQKLLTRKSIDPSTLKIPFSEPQHAASVT